MSSRIKGKQLDSESSFIFSGSVNFASQSNVLFDDESTLIISSSTAQITGTFTDPHDLVNKAYVDAQVANPVDPGNGLEESGNVLFIHTASTSHLAFLDDPIGSLGQSALAVDSGSLATTLAGGSTALSTDGANLLVVTDESTGIGIGASGISASLGAGLDAVGEQIVIDTTNSDLVFDSASSWTFSGSLLVTGTFDGSTDPHQAVNKDYVDSQLTNTVEGGLGIYETANGDVEVLNFDSGSVAGPGLVAGQFGLTASLDESTGIGLSSSGEITASAITVTYGDGIATGDTSLLLGETLALNLDVDETTGLGISGGGALTASNIFIDALGGLDVNGADALTASLGDLIQLSVNTTAGVDIIGDAVGIDVDGSNGSVTFVSGAYTWSFPAGILEVSGTPIEDNDVVNKAYVDSLSAGLDPKESVLAATTGSLTTVTSGSSFLSGSGDLDGILGLGAETLVSGSRVLVKDQSDPNLNGIYEVQTEDDTQWRLTRASDQDGSPANEVSPGNYTFVTDGPLSGSGWVVLSSGDTNDDGILTIGSEALNWSQFSDVGVTAGDGIDVAGNTVSVDVTDIITGNALAEDGSNNILVVTDESTGIGIGASGISASLGAGLTSLNEQIIVDSGSLVLSLDGAGLTGSATGELDVIGGAGIKVTGDAVVLDGASAAGAGLTGSDGVIDVVGGAGITVDADEIRVDSGSLVTSLAGAGLTGSTTGELDVVGGPGIVVNADSISASFGTGILAVSTASVDGTSSDLARVDHIHQSPELTCSVYNPTATSGDGAPTGITIPWAPFGDSHVEVKVNGVSYTVGDGTSTGTPNIVAFFTSSASPGVALSFDAITAGDALVWNGVSASFDLEATDCVTICGLTLD